MQPTDATPRSMGGTSDGFWDRYVANIRAKGVQSTAARWYVIRAEQYLQAFVHTRLADHTPQDVTDYLEKLGRIGSIADWQYRQTVDALQHLFVISEVTWVQQFDWAYLIGPIGRRPRVSCQCTIPPLRVRPLQQRFGATQNTNRRAGRVLPGFGIHRAVERLVTASTQNQARNALVFFAQHVLQQPLGDLDEFVRAKRPQRLPVVLTRTEVGKLLAHMHGTHGLMASLLYGTGMRLMDCIRLRVKDIDFAYNQIVVRDGKGQKDRVVPLPQRLVEPLQQHLTTVKGLHQADLEQGYGAVFMPHALACKYPQAPKEWGWQYVFPSARLSVDPRSGVIRRHHVHESGLQKAVKEAAQDAALTKPVNCHTLRHYAAHQIMP